MTADDDALMLGDGMGVTFTAAEVPALLESFWPWICRHTRCRTRFATTKAPIVRLVPDGRDAGSTLRSKSRRAPAIELHGPTSGNYSVKLLVHELLHARGFAHRGVTFRLRGKTWRLPNAHSVPVDDASLFVMQQKIAEIERI
jgi:hypothetical protein